MGLFGKKESKNFLGVDLGGSVIKVVELQNIQKRAKLITYGYVSKPIQDIGDNFLDHPDEMARILRHVCKESRVTTRRAITALPAPAVFSSVINLPNIKITDIKSRAKMDAAVKYEAKKIIPLPLEEMILDWKLLPNHKKGFGVQVLLTGAAKKLVKKYMDIFKKADLELVSLETESFALTRSLIGNDKSLMMIVDIGATSTYILVVDQGVPFLDRTINTAGSNITQAISDIMGIEVEKAEQFKADYALSKFAKGKKLPKVIESSFSPIIHEINYCFNLYQQDEYGGKDIEKIILSGGTSLLPNLTEYLSDLLKTRVYVGDPWARVIYPEEMKPLLNDIGSKFAIAIGLAMRDME